MDSKDNSTKPRRFKEATPLEQRLADSARLRTKYTDRIPVIVEPAPRCTLATIDRTKYLVPSDLTLGQFMYVIRQRLKLKSEVAMYFYVGNKLMTASALMTQIDHSERDEDGFLYITYQGEVFFG